MSGIQISRLPDGRLHLHHGPIDLICEAWGVGGAVEKSYANAGVRFDGLLEELVAELPGLRSEQTRFSGPIAQSMARAVAPFRPSFITPMAAVAGAVAEAVLAAMISPGLTRAYVNNGGDIAFHLAEGQSLTAAIAARPEAADRITIRAADPVRGIATSGWRGRSWSLGIADSVTVLAKSAALADAAATMIANAVDLPGHPAIARAPAQSLQADSDLGPRLVTTGVGHLDVADAAKALDRGLRAAERYRSAGLIEAAALFLQSQTRICGQIALKEPAFA